MNTNIENVEAQKEPSSLKESSLEVSFSVSNLALHKALKILSGVVDHSQVIQILGYIKCDLQGDQLSLIASNSEIEIHVSVSVTENSSDSLCSFTLPCRKLFDITRTLEEAELKIKCQTSWIDIAVGKTRFKLASLPANNFPQLTQFTPKKTLQISQNELLWLLNRTSFAMASQDVRFFLNGMRIGLTEESLQAVATDGHRLSLNGLDQSTFSQKSVERSDEDDSDSIDFIVPRKTIQELRKHLNETDETVEIAIGHQYISVISEDISIYSNLIDGQYPKYQKLIPKNFNHQVTVSVATLRQSISKMSILANEKFHGARFLFEPDKLTISTHNVNHEQAIDELPISLEGDPVNVGFNLMYLVDILNIITSDMIQINIVDAKNSVSFEEVGGEKDSLFIVMPLSI